MRCPDPYCCKGCPTKVRNVSYLSFFLSSILRDPTISRTIPYSSLPPPSGTSLEGGTIAPFATPSVVLRTCAMLTQEPHHISQHRALGLCNPFAHLVR